MIIHMAKVIWISLFLIAGTAVWVPTHAACGVRLTDGNLIVAPAAPMVDDFVTLYMTVDPDCGEDVEGTVTFRAGDLLLGQKPFSYKASGKAEEVWIGWTPTSAGTYLIQIDVSGSGDGDMIPAGLTRAVFVDTDTDGDGIGDAADPDDDNDGTPDTDDDFPRNPAKQKDTDGDGTDDAADSDDDNDGLYDFTEDELGTDPTVRDTDGDGVGDKEDAFPTDASKTAKDPQTTAGDASGEDQKNANDSSVAGAVDDEEDAISDDDATATPRTFRVDAERVIAAKSSEDKSHIPNSRTQTDSEIETEKEQNTVPWLLGAAALLLSLAGFFLRADRKRRKSEA